MFESLLNAFRAPDIRRRILFVLGILIVYRMLAQVPLPGIDREALAEFFQNNAAFGIIDLFAGGGLSAMSIVGLAMNPYINASIIMQLMTGVIPSLQALSKEGEYGRQRLNQYTRYLTVPMALLQAFGILSALAAQDVIIGDFGLGNAQSWVQMITLTAGAIVLMWLGELITEKGIGNGISFIIFAGIVSQAPAGLIQTLQQPSPRDIALFVILAIVAVMVIIYIQEGQRRIPIQYASRVRGRRMYQGGQTFLPLRVNLAGVIPIIFAISILAFPGQLAAYFSFSEVEGVRNVAHGDRRVPRADLHPVLDHLLPADRRVHVLLHGVHVQARRDRRAAAQERRVHPGHPPGPPDAGVPRSRRQPDHARRAPCSWARSRSRRCSPA